MTTTNNLIKMKNIQQIISGKSHEGIEFLNTPDKGGFFDLPQQAKSCTDPDHEPPKLIHIPQGKGYKHVCPSCGKERIIIPQQITL